MFMTYFIVNWIKIGIVLCIAEFVISFAFGMIMAVRHSHNVFSYYNKFDDNYKEWSGHDMESVVHTEEKTIWKVIKFLVFMINNMILWPKELYATMMVIACAVKAEKDMN